ncbi:hypothetical protein Tco_1290982 [Tanacetum coccineum]
MSTANQQTLIESGASDRPLILEKGSYLPWASWFLRFLDNKREEGELIRRLINKGPFKRKEIVDPNDSSQKIPKPIKDLSTDDQKKYYADIKVMNYILQGIPNDIYISVDACNDAQNMWNQIKRLMKEHYNVLYDYLSQFEPHVTTSKAKKVARNHDPMALVANSHANSSYSHASPSYSRSPQLYYVTHPSSVIDYEDDYQGEIQGDAQEDKLSTAMMLLAQAITQHYSTPTNNRLRTSSNTRNQAVIQDGRVDIRSKNIEEDNQNVQSVPRTESTPRKTNVQCHICNGKCHYAREFPKPRVRDAKYIREQILLAAKDKAGVNLDAKENDFMLMNAYGDDLLEELNAPVIMMARIQPTDEKYDAEPTYDAKLISEVNASQINMINGLLSKSDHEHKNHEKLKTVIHTSADDQIDSNIIFDDPYVDNNNGQAKHDTTAHDQPYADIESLIYIVQVEAKNQRKMNNELKKKKRCFKRNLRRVRNGLKNLKRNQFSL